MAPHLDSLVYVSEALVPRYSEAELSIQPVAESRNRLLGITGYLHRESDWFVQYLEGRKAALETLLESLVRDSRHTSLRVTLAEPISARRCAQWAMGRTGDLSEPLWHHLGGTRKMSPFDFAPERVRDYLLAMAGERDH